MLLFLSSCPSGLHHLSKTYFTCHRHTQLARSTYFTFHYSPTHFPHHISMTRAGNHINRVRVHSPAETHVFSAFSARLRATFYLPCGKYNHLTDAPIAYESFFEVIEMKSSEKKSPVILSPIRAVTESLGQALSSAGTSVTVRRALVSALWFL